MMDNYYDDPRDWRRNQREYVDYDEEHERELQMEEALRRLRLDRERQEYYDNDDPPYYYSDGTSLLKVLTLFSVI